MIARWIKPLFVVAGLYDLVLGVVFLFLSPAVFAYFAVTPPNHPGYVQFPALLLVLFGAMMVNISRDPVRHRAMIPYAMGLKVAYTGTVFAYWMTSGVPSMWVPWAWMDLAFLVVFSMAWARLERIAATAS